MPCSQSGPAVMAAEEWYASDVMESSSLTRKGTTCGFTWETIKWLTLKSSASLVIGRSLSTDPSIHR